MDSVLENPAVIPDRYPSRVADKPAVTRRIDPVVYGKAVDGPLDQTTLDHYEENGLLHFESLFDADDLQNWVDELNRLRGSATVKASPEAIVEPESQELRSIFAVHQSSGIMQRLAAHPKIVHIVEQLLGGPVYVHQSRINYKGGFRGKEFYWHSDFETWHVEDGLPAMRTVSCSISLTPNTPHNGPLMLIPGSHHRFVSCVGQTPENHYKESLRRQELGVPDEDSLTKLVHDFGIVAPTGPAGSVTFFDCNTMHGSSSNITPMARSNIFIVYNSLQNKPVAPFCGLAPRPNFIAEREDFTPASKLV
ncbi:MAG: ectoine hydroxylase [Burkholderiaceae bacterium]|nr:ectoine hydroxylase [Burkholderiaceae bacterium]MCD8537011.1 ectoine hydroxylase [Burkholderiaceae bacterium]MCD8565123.1 ectoine hydroxylase [Burkholderiaceae bacterium]